jgi:hypothetical protein
MAQFRNDKNNENVQSPRKWRQKKTIIAVAGLTLALFYAGANGFGFLPFDLLNPAGSNSALAEKGDPLKCDFSGNDSQMITVKLENVDLTGAELRVPRAYLTLPATDGGTREALGLRVWRDSFLPYTTADSISEDQGKKLSEGRADGMSILLSSLKDLDSIAKLHIWSSYPRAGDVNENRRQPVSGPLVALKNGISGYLTKDGLLQQEKLATPRFNELLLAVENSEITDVFQCSQIGDVPSPGCSQIFEYGAYDVEISYYRDDLPRWRELKQKTVQLLDCLTTKVPENTMFDDTITREQAEFLWQKTLPQM